MLTGYDIVCISSIDWDVIWQGHQEIMSTFAKQGTRVLSALFLRWGPRLWPDVAWSGVAMPAALTLGCGESWADH